LCHKLKACRCILNRPVRELGGMLSVKSWHHNSNIEAAMTKEAHKCKEGGMNVDVIDGASACDWNAQVFVGQYRHR